MVQRDLVTRRTRSAHTGSPGRKSAARPPHRRMLPAVELSHQYLFPMSQPQNQPQPLQQSRRSILQEPDPDPVDSTPDHTPSSRSNYPWQTHRSSAFPVRQRPLLLTSQPTSHHRADGSPSGLANRL